MNTINHVSLTDLRNNEYFNLIFDLKTLLPGVIPSNPKTDEVLAGFEELYTELDTVSNVDPGSILTEKVQAADTDRGNTWKAMDLMIDAHLYSPIPKEVESAKVLRRVFDVYGDFRRKTYVAESGDAKNLIQDLEKQKNEEHVQRVKLSRWVPIYKTQQSTFEALQNERDVESGYKSSGNVKAVRIKMDPMYREIINLVNSFINIGMASPEMENFVIVMNQKIKRYNDLLAIRQGRNEKEEDSVVPESE